MARTSTDRDTHLTPEREQAIAITLLGCAEFRARAGLPPRNTRRPESFALLAAVAGVSRQRISQVYQRAIRKLSHALHNHHELH